MNQIEYHLFRVKFIRPKQQSLLHDSRSASDIFKYSIFEKPTVEFKENHIWHIGNIEEYSASSGSFALGRTTKTTLSKYDKLSGNFTEDLFDDSPYTYCIYDLSVGFVAIAKKSKLAPTVTGISRRLKVVLENAEAVKINEIRVIIDPISDPDGFILKLQTAHSIRKFTAHFTGPNPIDADLLFQKPISVYCQAANGEKGKVEVEGSDLNSETLIAVTHSTAASGNEVSAKITEMENQRPKKIHLRGDAVKRSYDEDNHNMELVAMDMRQEYQRIRND
jgi:hypothetical protein